MILSRHTGHAICTSILFVILYKGPLPSIVTINCKKYFCANG